MKCKHCGDRMRKQLLCENCEVVVLRECGPAMSDLEKARTRLQRAEELLREIRGEIDYRYDDEEELVVYKERIDAFLGESHD